MTDTATVDLPGVRLSAGDHICAFYRRPEERDDILIPYLMGGLATGSKCTCVVDSCAPDHILERLAAESVDVTTCCEQGQLEVLDSDSTYLDGGGFLPQRMLEFWASKARWSGSADNQVVRNTGDMTWAHKDKPGVEDLAMYESELNRIMSGYPQIVLCLYDMNRCDGEMVLDVLKTHPKAMLGGMVINNPYYLEPDDFLASRIR
ncbi:MAG: MEDS domain-containing protein [Actinomycetota bacterium]|nr:MEDS domain-containing protein [Actinomycetota bacterium]MDQ3732405.1 MEDS domain-containing protein [Actinomycetota bacterium]